LSVLRLRVAAFVPRHWSTVRERARCFGSGMQPSLSGVFQSDFLPHKAESCTRLKQCADSGRTRHGRRELERRRTLPPSCRFGHRLARPRFRAAGRSVIISAGRNGTLRASDDEGVAGVAGGKPTRSLPALSSGPSSRQPLLGSANQRSFVLDDVTARKISLPAERAADGVRIRARWRA